MKTQTPEAWHTELHLALLAANATEEQVAEAVADVESFCADSGQSPAEAFGDPRAYVAQLGLSRAITWRDRLEYLVHVPTMLGIFVTFDGVNHLVDGTRSSLTWGHLAAALLLSLTTVGFATALFAGRKLVTMLVGATGMSAAVLAAVTIVEPLVAYAPVLGIVVGIVTLAITATIGTIGSLRDRAAARAALAARGLPGPTEGGTWTIVMAHWSVVVAAFVFAWVIALVARLAGASG